jgi:hypothetical protein
MVLEVRRAPSHLRTVHIERGSYIARRGKRALPISGREGCAPVAVAGRTCSTGSCAGSASLRGVFEELHNCVCVCMRAPNFSQTTDRRHGNASGIALAIVGCRSRQP